MKQLASFVCLLCVALLVGWAAAGEPDGMGFGPTAAAPGDFDGDGIPDEDDSDDDDDGVVDSDDDDPVDPNVCSDLDEDLCDDCTSGTYDIMDDGPDEDGDGLCDAGDPYTDAEEDYIEGRLELTGGSCSVVRVGAERSRLGLWIFAAFLTALFFTRRKLSLLMTALTTAVFVGLFALPHASALEEKTIDVQAFKPSPFINDLYNVSSGATLDDTVRFSAGLYLNYQNDPLVLRALDSGDETVKVMEHQLTADVLAAFYLLPWLDVGFGIPVNVYQSGEGLPLQDEPATASLGDIRVHAKVRLFHMSSGAFSLAFAPQMTIPTGSQFDAYSGSLGVSALLPLAISSSFDRFGFAINAGYRIVTNETTTANLKLQDQLVLRAGAWAWLVPEELSLIAEFLSATPISDPYQNMNESPMEVIAGLRYLPAEWIHINVGGGLGVTEGLGAPDYRVMAGVEMMIPFKGKDVDSDGDGLFDLSDSCPQVAEDKDAFEDLDGCPDPDNDADGILDVDDSCPLEAEDKDEFEDENGCPDPDNDADGILDIDDGCPLEAEDKDGFEDENGCPDLDHDGDNVLDPNDRCPAEPEDADKHEDEDGCPDPDNDADGICDPWVASHADPRYAENCKGTDQCPDEPETINQKEDDDGCPDLKAKVVKDKIVITEKVYFKMGTARIRSVSHEVLNDVVTVLESHPEIDKLRIEGHTDGSGKESYNRRLSTKRAASVKRYLVKKGIAEERLESEGFGSSRRVVERERTKKDYEANRRVEFVILDSDK